MVTVEDSDTVLQFVESNDDPEENTVLGTRAQ